VVVVNAAKLAINPRKASDKQYYRHSGYPGGLRSESLETLLARVPKRASRLPLRAILPKAPPGRRMLKKLRASAGPTHPHQAQQPVVRELASARCGAPSEGA